MRATLWLTLLLTLLAGCERGEDVNAQREKDLNKRFAGRPLSDYVQESGQKPESEFDMESGERIFVFGPPCKSHWHTKPQGVAGAASDYIVTKVEVHFCQPQKK